MELVTDREGALHQRWICQRIYERWKRNNTPSKIFVNEDKAQPEAPRYPRCPYPTPQLGNYHSRDGLCVFGSYGEAYNAKDGV